MPVTLPGTAIPFNENAEDNAYGQIAPIITATGGLSLSQLSALTGLEGSTIQNWIKRGWVAPSSGKKYGERSVVRILLINILRSTLKLEDIAKLMRYVNGEVNDTEDDIMHDTPLYDLLCSVVCEVERERLQSEEEITAAIERRIPEGHSERERRILTEVLLIMTQSAMSGYYRSLAQSEFDELRFSEIGGKLK